MEKSFFNPFGNVLLWHMGMGTVRTQHKTTLFSQDMQQNTDERWMRRCLQLARCGQAHAAPNPMVGAVVVCRGTVIGEGYHRRAGEPHAEVMALSKVKNPSMLPSSTIYVNLEPCAHFGRTPPCADLIIRMKVGRVVVGCTDPFAQVKGRGIAKLREAGIDVTVGVLERECLMLNRRFITFHEKGRPFITLKWAQSSDGFIDKLHSQDESGTWISDSHTQMVAHKLRAEHQAIMVGRHTAAIDNPRLDVRAWSGEDPLRIVLDMHCKLPATLHIFSDGRPTLIVSGARYTDPRPGVEYFHPDVEYPILPQLMKELHRREIQSLLVEGGGILLQNMINENLWDEAQVEISSVRFLTGVDAPQLPRHCPRLCHKMWNSLRITVWNDI